MKVWGLRLLSPLHPRRPVAEQAPEGDQLAQVVGVVVGHQQGLAQERLAHLLQLRVF